MKDLAVIVADKNMSFAVRGLPEQQAKSLGIRPIEFEIDLHPGHDGGVRATGPATLARPHREFRHGIIMLDWEGSGSDQPGVEGLEAELDDQLRMTWDDRAKAIVIDPEVDAWVWGKDGLVKEILGWGEDLSIREWLRSRDFEFTEAQKPIRPKEALQALMRHLRRPRTSADYQSLTSLIGLRRCTDPAFGRPRKALQGWFPA